MNEYYKGQKVKMSAEFTVDDVAADPTTVSLLVQDPSGTTTTYLYSEAAITKTDTGDYYKEITASSEGVYKYGFVGTGAVATAKFDEFIVRAWPFS